MTTKTSCDHESTHFFFASGSDIYISTSAITEGFFLFIIYYYVIFNSINLNI